MQQGFRSIRQSNIRKETNPRPRYESGFNGYCYFFLTLVIRIWIVDSMKEEVLEAPMTKLDVVHVIKLDIILPPIAHGDATLAVGLVTNPKNVQVKKVNQGGVLHTHQQEEPMNL